MSVLDKINWQELKETYHGEIVSQSEFIDCISRYGITVLFSDHTNKFASRFILINDVTQERLELFVRYKDIKVCRTCGY